MKNRATHTQIIALGFVITILVGALLLMLPLSSRSGQSTNFLDCLFTATSATCVTGLVVVDTSNHWSVFGQCVLLLLIQIGGLGFLTMGVFFSIVLKRKITLKVRGILQDSMNVLRIGGIVRLAKHAVIGSLIIEAIGAALLSLRFIPQFGLWKGIYFSVFHAVSAFCNAGFDLMGFQEPYNSLCGYSSDALVNIVIMTLIIIGGIGFIVWEDISNKKIHFNKYMLHTKMTLLTTAILLVASGLLFYVFERDGLLIGMSGKETALACAFSSVTPRTAGFNTIDTGALKDCSKLLTMALMFVGGSSGSTAGGIKTTTLLVLLVYLWSNLRSSKSCTIFHRRLDDEAIKKAGNVLVISLILAMLAIISISFIQALPLEDIMFEVFSAIGTAGMSTGITRQLLPVSRLIIIFLMFCGRVGSMSCAMTLMERRKAAPVELPSENIMVG